MFQKICIKPNEHSFPVDVGFLAENLLYYQEVNIVAGTNTIAELANKCGIEILIELLARKNLRILLKENFLGVSAPQTDVEPILTSLLLVDTPKLTTEELIYRGMYNLSGRKGYSRRVANRLLPYIKTIRYDSNICNIVREDIRNSYYFKQAIIDTIKLYNPLFTIRQEEIEYGFIETRNGFLFKTNLDYERINKNIPNNPDGKIINSLGLILNILETRGDVYFASELNSEIATTSIHTELMKIKFQDIYKKTAQSSDNLFKFNDFALSKGHAIREVINSGEKGMKDFFSILDKADKFREWLKSVEDDKNLIREYHEAVIADTWIDKIPSKILRWTFFTGASIGIDLVTGGIGGLVVGIGDAFLVDKLAKGWKPNIFIDNQLRPFVKH